MRKDPLELLLQQYLSARNEHEKRKAEAKLLLQYPNSKIYYTDQETKQKYKVIIRDRVTVIPYII